MYVGSSATPESSAVHAHRIIDRAARAVTEAHEAMVQVVVVGLVERLPPRHAAHEREHRVDDRDAEDHERDHERREEEVGVAAELHVGAAADR